MKNIGIIGMQNGDEGKGKIVEFIIGLLESMLIPELEKILAYRWQGGPNAGHTIKIGDLVYQLHQISSGIVKKVAFCLLGKGMLLNPRKLVEEIAILRESGIPVSCENLGVSSKTHVILDHHVSGDQASFNLKEHESTGNGIKQAAGAKYLRQGIRFIEFLCVETMAKILHEKIFTNNTLEQCRKYAHSYDPEREVLRELLVQELEVFMRPEFKYKVAEGAQAILLDIDDGQYPGITSSSPGLPTHRPDLLIGVFKAYVSSVGISERPFVSEMGEELQNFLRSGWQEFGTSTGKPRHIGWFDAVAAKYAMNVSHIDLITLTCLDRLADLSKADINVKVVVGYNIDGKIYKSWDVSFDNRETLKYAKPVFETFDYWDQTTEKDGKTFTRNAQKYVDGLEEILGQRFALIGTGPESKQIVVREEYFQTILF